MLYIKCLFLSRNKKEDVIDVLLAAGSHFLPGNPEVTRELIIAATNNDLESLRFWKKVDVDLNASDVDGKTPLHYVSLANLKFSNISALR